MAPAGRHSIRSLPSVTSATFLPKSWNFVYPTVPASQAVCIFILIGAAADRRITPGKPMTPAAAPVATAAVFKKLRRDPFSPVIFSSFTFLLMDIPPSSLVRLVFMNDPAVETSPVHHLIGMNAPKGCAVLFQSTVFYYLQGVVSRTKNDDIAVGETGQASGSDIHRTGVILVVYPTLGAVLPLRSLAKICPSAKTNTTPMRQTILPTKRTDNLDEYRRLKNTDQSQPRNCNHDGRDTTQFSQHI